MQGSSGTWKHSKRSGPVRVVRRIVVTVVVVLIALATLGGVLVAVGKDRNSKTPLAGKLLGSSTSTVALHYRAPVGEGWTVKVTSVRLHAFQRLGGAPKKTAPGGRDAMVSLSLGYTGNGYGHLRELLGRLYVSGPSSSAVNYQPDGGNLNCSPRPGVGTSTPLNEKSTLVFRGHVARGHLCFLFPHPDAKTLALYVDKPGCNTAGPGADNCEDRVTFALRR
jgi:hypothetical protein